MECVKFLAVNGPPVNGNSYYCYREGNSAGTFSLWVMRKGQWSSAGGLWHIVLSEHRTQRVRTHPQGQAWRWAQMVLQLDTEVVGAPAVGSSLAESCGLVLRRVGLFYEDPRILEQASHSHLGLSQSQPPCRTLNPQVSWSPFLTFAPSLSTCRKICSNFSLDSSPRDMCW